MNWRNLFERFLPRNIRKATPATPLQAKPAPLRDIKTSGNYYYCYENADPDYFGAKSIIEAEQQLLQSRRPGDKPRAGLALSGGGIRSASFCLGVLQALSYKRGLPQIDYLSTVSGGGYIGSCLSYLLHRPWPTATATHPTGKPVHFGVDRDNFPLGSYPMTGQDPQDRPALSAASLSKDDLLQRKNRGSLLRFLRQHAKFLTPGNGHNIVTLIAVLLRNSLLCFAFYLFLLTVTFAVVGHWVLFPSVNELIHYLAPQFKLAGSLPAWFNISLLLALVLLAIYVVLIPVYAFVTFLFGRVIKNNWPHRLRYRYEVQLTSIILWAALLGVVGSLPIIYKALQQPGQQSTAIVQPAATTPTAPNSVVITVKSAESDKPPKNTFTLISAIVSAIAGIFSAIGAFLQTTQLKKRPWLQNILISVAVVALLYAMAMLALWITAIWYRDWSWWWLLTLVIPVVGWFQNLNYVSMHRYYRDRLAETFMPDVSRVICGDADDTCLSAVGNNATITQLWGGNDPQRAATDKFAAPYHIINANVILVSSKIAKFRGRGGDNFILSPLFCGSNATGWAASSSVLYNDLSLASAMAISGAALNTNAGCGGDGLTRNPLLSLLMGILNVRLGYWLPNPKWLTHRREYGADEQRQTTLISHCQLDQIKVGKPLSRLLMHGSRFSRNGDETPNLFYPGLDEILLRNNLNEDSALVQLSDGGHFENLGMYELIRRRLPFILVVDGAADPDYQFDDLANAIEKIRTDFGALITFQHSLDDLVPRCDPNTAKDPNGVPPMRYAKRSYLIGRIDYANNTTGVLVYLTTTFIKGLSSDLYGYRCTHPVFPDEPTSDQFFDEKQFEAYRELGYQLAYLMLNDPAIKDEPTIKAALGI